MPVRRGWSRPASARTGSRPAPSPASRAIRWRCSASTCQKAGRPLVDPHVQTQPAVEIGSLEGKCEGRVARAWTPPELTHDTPNPFIDDGCGFVSGRINPYKKLTW